MGDLEDFQGFRRYFENELNRLEAAEIDDRDREAIAAYIDRQVGDLAVATLASYATDLRMAAGYSDTPLVELGEDDFWSLRADITTNPEYGTGDGPLAPATAFRRVTVVRMFCEHLGREWAADISMSPPDPPDISPDEMLTQADVAAMRDAGQRNRRIALCEFLADTGARLSLVGSLRVGDVSLDGERATYTPNSEAIGLKGASITEYPIIDAKGVLRNYLRTTHPRPDDPDVALFHKLKKANAAESDRGAIAPNTLRRDLRILAERAGVDKPVNPHNFRHSAITRMVREGYTRTEIEHRVHWTLDTDMWERYVHLEAEQVNDDIWARAGQGEADGGPTAARKQCTNCMETMPPESDFCPFCTAPANRRGRLVERAVIRLLTSRLRSADDEAAAQGYDRLLNDVLSGDADLSTIDVSDHDELASLLSASE